ncbi:hypothetical protein OPQ81_002480 [Rhizoctonia solani]|nr:hypothetical protein OPQ81_002480 [Rhizoctonia solani]
MVGLQCYHHISAQAHHCASAPYPPPPPPLPPPGGPGLTPGPEDDQDPDQDPNNDALADHPLDSNQSPLLTDAHQLTRMVAMFWLAHNLLNASNQLCWASDNGSEQMLQATTSDSYVTNTQIQYILTIIASLVDRQKKYYCPCNGLDLLQPNLFDMVASKDSSFMQNVWDKLSDGHTGAKAKDNHKVKHLVLHMRFACSSYLPLTLTGMMKSNIEKPSEGLLKGELLVKAAKVILESPSSVLPSVNIWPGAVRQGRRGIAAKYQLMHIMPQFLAYVAVVTRFAVSAEEVFSDDGGVFNYIDFYDQVCEYLEAPRFQAQAQVLIAWCNRYVFCDPDMVVATVLIDSSQKALPELSSSGGKELLGRGDIQYGMLSLLEAELEASADREDSDN